MNSNRYDIIFIGGGLANGLAAFRYSQVHPSARILLIEKENQLGGNHTWSFHDSDLTPDQNRWISRLVSKHWTTHEVRFPTLARHIPSGYNSILSSHFHNHLIHIPGLEIRFGQPVVSIGAHGVNLKNGDYFEADTVIDGTGWVEPPAMAFGYQKFVGLDVTLEEPHWIAHPVLMDATVPQEDGFRFFYILPWDSHRLLIEDTRYSNNPDLFAEYYKADIRTFIKEKGWTIKNIDRIETGVLPIPLSDEPPRIKSKAAVSGMKAWYFHPTTGYSLPWAVRFADMLVKMKGLTTESLKNWTTEIQQAHWIEGKFFRILNRLMFRAASPEKRFRVLEKFYSLPQDTIERFYAGRLNRKDIFKILTGKPPVPVTKALQCLFKTN